MKVPAGSDVVPYVRGGEIKLPSELIPQRSLPATVWTNTEETAQAGTQSNTGAVPDTSTVAVTDTVDCKHTVTTVTDAVPLAVPEVAVIVAVPSATAATSPVEETLATDELEEVHVMDAPLIVAPF